MIEFTCLCMNAGRVIGFALSHKQWPTAAWGFKRTSEGLHDSDSDSDSQLGCRGG